MVGQTTKHPEWRVIVDLLRAVDWGGIVTHAQVSDATGLRGETVTYYRQVSQARKVLLRDHDIEIESVPKVGYRRVEPNRYGERGRRDLRLGTRRIRRGERVIEAAPSHLLTAEQVKELEHAMLLLRAVKQQAAAAFRSMKNVLEPVQPHKALLAGLKDDADQTH